MEVAEGRQKQSQEQLEGITQQVSELQSKCTELKAEVQRRNADFKSCEVCVWTLIRTSKHEYYTILFHSVCINWSSM